VPLAPPECRSFLGLKLVLPTELGRFFAAGLLAFRRADLSFAQNHRQERPLMAHKITSAGAERVLRELRDLVQAVDDRVLAPASLEARAEWEGLVQRLPSNADADHGLAGVSEDELGRLLQKATRFLAILLSDTAPIYDTISTSSVARHRPASPALS
jgi:hypothetical protein